MDMTHHDVAAALAELDREATAAWHACRAQQQERRDALLARCAQLGHVELGFDRYSSAMRQCALCNAILPDTAQG